jgi:signal transduction histidine kinase/CheY-like chemotaxis protein
MGHTKTILLVFSLSLLPLAFTFGQIDSLLQLAGALPDGKEKADVYKNLAFHSYTTAPDSALLFCDSLEAIGQRLGEEEYRAKAHYFRAASYLQKGAYPQALEYASTALEQFKAQNNPINESACLSLKGNIYSRMGLLEKAAESLLSAAQLGEVTGDTINAAIGYHNLGNLLFELEDKTQAAKYYRMAIDAYRAMEYLGFMGQAHIALSNVLSDPDSVYYHIQQGDYYIEKYGVPYQMLTVYHTYAHYFGMVEDYEISIAYERKTLNLANEFEDRQFKVAALIGMGETFWKINQIDSAINYIQKGVDLGEAYGLITEIKSGYLDLAELYQSQQRLSESNRNYQKAYQLQDSLHAANITEQIQINTARFELERKERRIAEQELQLVRSENTRNRILLIALFVLGLIVIAYQWFLRQQQRRKQAAELALAKEQTEAARLRELDELKTNFFTNISHELRTPLTLILSPLADLQEQVKAVPVRDKLNIIKGNAQRLLSLVNEIMDLAKIEAGKLEIQKSSVDIRELVRRIFYSFESLADLRRLSFQLDYKLEEKYLMIDREKLEKILHNLLSNAIKYTGAGGAVSMRVDQQGSMLAIEVTDTGQGMDAGDLSRVFDRFYQAKHGNLQGGSGVGLSLSKELAELMQGTLSAESQPGRGSTFRLLLPLEVPPPAVAPKSPPEIPETAAVDFKEAAPSGLPFAPIAIAGEKPRLLVVEDNPEMGKYLVQILSTHYQCVLATDGEEAIQQLKRSRFDCITSDVMMPNMDGFELRSHINQHNHWKQIPFLLLTARHLEEDKIRGLQMGIDDYITKPFSTRELVARIHNLINNKIERDSFLAEHSEPEEERPNVDQQLLQQAEQEVLAHIDNPQFGVEGLAHAIGYSSKQLGRLLKKLTGMSTVNFILEIRLQKARELLEKRMCATVIEAQMEVGISSTSYFTRKFTERFGKNPKEFLMND